MSIRAPKQNFPSLDITANAKEHGLSHPFFPPHGEADHPYPNPLGFQSNNGQVGRPGHPYPSPWAHAGDKDQGEEANKKTGDVSASRKPHQRPDPAGGHPPYTFPGYAQQPHIYPGPLPWHPPNAYYGLTEGRKPRHSHWDDDKPKPSPCRSYHYPGPADGDRPHSIQTCPAATDLSLPIGRRRQSAAAFQQPASWTW
ncbi:unnamed protein product [Penicillium egyptiacum]|uniref:Uncharacterized protein n=1 Tax=Penicillium egyptiacum TaxID=1303716 RepID=A0A9W4K8L9_9EURO|nr:unnamed protein product [Penicillium egyptiacum]